MIAASIIILLWIIIYRAFDYAELILERKHELEDRNDQPVQVVDDKITKDIADLERRVQSLETKRALSGR